MPKSGSNAMQSCLSNSRDVLLEKGVLYPTSTFKPEDRHHCLAIPTFGERWVPYCFINQTRVEKLKIFDDFYNDLKRQIAYSRPKCLLLSTETLFNSLADVDILYELLCQFSNDNEIVSAVRKPVDFYQSIIHEILKRTHILPNFEYQVKSILELYTKKFCSVRVWSYEGDSVGLVGNVLKNFDIAKSSLILPDKLNKSASAEGTYLLQRYRRHFHLDNAWKKTRDTDTFLKVLSQVEQKCDVTSIKLKSQIAENIRNECKSLESWLLESFEDYQPFQIAEINEVVNVHTPDITQGTGVEELIEIDSSKLKLLVINLLETEWAKSNKKFQNWLSILIA